MYRLRVSKSYGGEAPMNMIGCYGFVKKEEAIAEAIKCVPEGHEMKWVSGKEGDIKFQFRVRTMLYQMWIDKFPTVTSKDLLKDNMITDFPIFSPTKGFHFV